ncbi:MAG: KH domain-containing protein [Chloroflexi bacterium]|nr:KH domain-containing protein [Chloroflexota bacterium]
MSQEKTTLEIIAPSVEEAVERGLSQLGLSREAVELEVLDPGSRGLFGLGGRQARVRLTLMPDGGFISPKATIGKAEPQSLVEQLSQEPALQPSQDGEVILDERALRVAQDTVDGLMQRMKIRATVTAHYVQPEDEKDQSLIMVDIQGNDLSILIGRRSETLNALQYITNLIVGKELGHWVPLMIDVQGYRHRREMQLRKLARRMAEQALHTGRRQVLEPMPANERRLIHLELRDFPGVQTESIGEEPVRKVTIFVKK